MEALRAIYDYVIIITFTPVLSADTISNTN